MSKIYKFNYHWLNELSKHKDMLDNDTRILVTYIEVLQQENKKLKEEINKALKELKYVLPVYTTPIGEVIHLEDKLASIERAIKILRNKEDNTITLNTKDMNITGGKYER